LRDKVLRVTNRVFKYVSAAGPCWRRRAPAYALAKLTGEYNYIANEGNFPWMALVIEVMAELSPWPGIF